VLAAVLLVIAMFCIFGMENYLVATVTIGTALSMLAFVGRGAAERDSQNSLLRLASLGSVAVFVSAVNAGGFNGTTAFWIVCLPLVALEFTNFRHVWRSIAGGLLLLAGLVATQLALPGIFRSYGDLFRWRSSVFDHFGLFATASILVVTAYRSRQKLNDEISSQNVLLSRLLQILGHDLANSISVIQSHHRRLPALVNGPALTQNEAQLSKTIATMGRHLELLEGLVQKSKLLARWQSGAQLETHRMHLLDAVIIAWQLCQAHAERKGISMDLRADELIAWVQSDQGLLVHEGFQNFFSNAIKFSPESAKIRVRAQSADECLIVTIEDSGAGIPMDVLNGLNSNDSLRSAAGTSGEKGN
jgi:signal transduction histidine kinase